MVFPMVTGGHKLSLVRPVNEWVEVMLFNGSSQDLESKLLTCLFEKPAERLYSQASAAKEELAL
jgi:hypothetical protein